MRQIQARPFIPDLPGRQTPEDTQSRAPAGKCTRCGGELYPGEPAYGRGRCLPSLCQECFLEQVYRMPVSELADSLGFSAVPVDGTEKK